jgi:hypothetical protein
VSELAYFNFDLLIERAEPDYRVRVLASPAGESRPVWFRVPFSDLEVENFLLRIGRPGRNARRSALQVTAIKDFGGRLFEAVFPAELHVNLAISQSRADAIDAGCGFDFGSPIVQSCRSCPGNTSTTGNATVSLACLTALRWFAISRSPIRYVLCR